MESQDAKAFQQRLERLARRSGYPKPVAQGVASDLMPYGRFNSRARDFEVEIHEKGSAHLSRRMARSYDRVWAW